MGLLTIPLPHWPLGFGSCLPSPASVYPLVTGLRQRALHSPWGDELRPSVPRTLREGGEELWFGLLAALML